MHTFSVRVGAMAWVRQEAFVGTSSLCSQIPIAIVCGLNTSCPRWKSVFECFGTRAMCWTAGCFETCALSPLSACSTNLQQPHMPVANKVSMHTQSCLASCTTDTVPSAATKMCTCTCIPTYVSGFDHGETISIYIYVLPRCAREGI